jgi:hypothetical protein
MSAAEKVLKLAEAALVAALAWTVLVTIPRQIQTAANAVRTDTQQQATETRNAVVGLLQPVAHGMSLLPGDVTKIVNDRSRDAVAIVSARTETALGIVGRVGDGVTHTLDRFASVAEASKPALAEIGPTLVTLRTGLGEVGPTLAAVRPGLVNVGLMTADVRAAIAPHLECKGNPACWPAGIDATLGGTKTLMGEAGLTMRYWRKETPEIAGSVAQIAGNGAKISKPHWYWKAAPIVGGIIVGIISAKR